MRMNINKEKGFTLVELAIVLVIVGLLIGGVLKGQQLLINSRITATVAQVKAIEAATTSFRDAYGGLPGDLKNSYLKIPGCASTAPGTNDDVCDAANADGSIGSSTWNMTAYQPVPVATASPGNVGNETLLFWYSLEKSGLISAVTEAALLGTSPAFGKTVPAAKIGGGFWAGDSGSQSAGRPAGAGTYTLLGPIITLVPDPSQPLTFTKKTGPLTPDLAANIDRKLDDGMPERGAVQAYGYVAVTNLSCYGAATAPFAYQEGIKDQDCGVHIRIQR